MHIAGLTGQRDVAAEDFFQDVFETAIGEGEILTGISIPKTEANEAQVIEEVARRSGDYALAGLCLVKRSAGHRLALFSVGPRPLLARTAMTALDRGDVEGAAEALRNDMDPPSDTQASSAYRQHLAQVLLRRAAARIEGANA